MYLFAYLKIMMMDTKEKHKTNKNRMITESSSEMDTTKLSIKMFLRKLIPDYNKMNIIVTYIQKKKNENKLHKHSSEYMKDENEIHL